METLAVIFSVSCITAADVQLIETWKKGNNFKFQNQRANRQNYGENFKLRFYARKSIILKTINVLLRY